MTRTRREFLRDLAVSAPFIVSPGALAAVGRDQAAAPPWDRAAAILRRIVPPRFPSRHFEITRFGAVGDGRADCTSAIRRAIAACRAAGGGRVVVPPGRFVTGAIKLASGTELHLTPKATLAFSRDAKHYLPVVLTRWEGTELMNYSPFIYAFEAENIAITGTGTLDGQADANNWWNWRGEGGKKQAAARDRLMDLGARGVPVRERVFGEGHWLRPNFIQPYRCRNVLIEGVTIVNSPMWEIHPVLCQNVTVRNVTIRSHGPNNDGCDPESCRDVLIEGCTFDTGDDCIALKSGRNDDGRRVNVPIENVIVRELHDEGRPWRRRDRQRDLRRRAEHLRGALPDGQPAARSRASHQDQLGARRRGRTCLHARRDGRRGRRSRGHDRLTSTRKGTRESFRPSSATSRSGT